MKNVLQTIFFLFLFIGFSFPQFPNHQTTTQNDDGTITIKYYYKDIFSKKLILTNLETYYENGQLKALETYYENRQLKALETYYENGQLKNQEAYNEYGEYDSKIISYYENGQIKSKSNYIDGNLIGEKTTYLENGQIIKLSDPPPRPSVPVASEDDLSDDDITVKDTVLDDFSDWEGPDALGRGPSEEFIPYDQAPRPRTPLSDILVYPELAKEAGIEGKVYVKAFINVKGIVKSARIVTGVPNTGLDEAALKAVKKSRWYPARQRDKKVGVWITIPIDFSLTN